MTPKTPGARITLAELESLLENLEKQVANTWQPERQARVLNLAGDMCTDAGQLERGLAYYDQAITTYTAAEQYEAAGKVCEKIIALKPDAVRPFYTLALLAIQQQKMEQACERVAQYVNAAEAQKLGNVARHYLRQLAEANDDAALLEAITSGVAKLNESESNL